MKKANTSKVFTTGGWAGHSQEHIITSQNWLSTVQSNYCKTTQSGFEIYRVFSCLFTQKCFCVHKTQWEKSQIFLVEINWAGSKIELFQPIPLHVYQYLFIKY